MGHFRLLLAVLMLGTVCIQVQSIERRSTTASFKKISKLNEELDKLTAKQEELSSRFKKLDDRKAAVKKAWLAKKQRLSKLISNRIKAIDMKKVSSSAITALASVGIEITPQASKFSANKTGNKDGNSTQFDLGLLYDELFQENTKLGQLVSEIEQTQSQIRGETKEIENIANQIQGLQETSISKNRLWERKLDELELMTKLLYEKPENQTQVLNKLSEQELKYAEQIEHEVAALANSSLQVANQVKVVAEEERVRKDYIKNFIDKDLAITLALNLTNNTGSNQTTNNSKSQDGFSFSGLFGKIFGSNSENVNGTVSNSNTTLRTSNSSNASNITAHVGPPSSNQANGTILHNGAKQNHSGIRASQFNHSESRNYPSNNVLTKAAIEVVTNILKTPAGAPGNTSSGNSNPHLQSTTIIMPPSPADSGPPMVIIHNHQTTINVLPGDIPSPHDGPHFYSPQLPQNETQTHMKQERVVKVGGGLQGGKPSPVV